MTVEERSLPLLIQQSLQQGGLSSVVTRSFPQPAHHASQAAELIGCPLGAVVKSLVFQTEADHDPVLVRVSGGHRADLDMLAQVLGQAVSPVSRKAVESLTGYPVGAVPPFGLSTRLPVLVDADLLDYKTVWASAGSVNTLMQLTPDQLLALTQGLVVQLRKEG